MILYRVSFVSKLTSASILDPQQKIKTKIHAFISGTKKSLSRTI